MEPDTTDAPKGKASLSEGSRKAMAKSRISSGKDLLPNVDGRSVVARRYRDISSQIVADMGGIERCSESRIQLIRRFAAAACIAEQMEARLANGEEIDIGEHALLCSTFGPRRPAHRHQQDSARRDADAGRVPCAA